MSKRQQHCVWSPEEFGIESSHARAYRWAEGQKRESKAIGGSRSGKTGEIRLLAHHRGRRVDCALTPGNVAAISLAAIVSGWAV